MVGLIIGTVLLAGSLCILAGAVIYNQLEPSYVSALTVAFANAAALAVAMLGVLVALLAYGMGTRTRFAKAIIAAGLLCLVVLAILFTLADRGVLSRVQ